jgi:hypothetical protein
MATPTRSPTSASVARRYSPAPPAAFLGLHADAVATATEGAGAGVLPAACAGHLAQPGVATDQLEEIDPLLDRRRIDRHAANLTGGL